MPRSATFTAKKKEFLKKLILANQGKTFKELGLIIDKSDQFTEFTEQQINKKISELKKEIPAIKVTLPLDDIRAEDENRRESAPSAMNQLLRNGVSKVFGSRKKNVKTTLIADSNQITSDCEPETYTIVQIMKSAGIIKTMDKGSSFHILLEKTNNFVINLVETKEDGIKFRLISNNSVRERWSLPTHVNPTEHDFLANADPPECDELELEFLIVPPRKISTEADKFQIEKLYVDDVVVAVNMTFLFQVEQKKIVIKGFFDEND